MNIILLILFWLLVLAVLFTTLTPLTNSVQWWVRGWDFPRIHIAIIALIVAVLGLFLWQSGTWLASIIMLACALYQGYRIAPYTRFATPEIMLNDTIPEDEHISILSFNVLMENKDHQSLKNMINREQPDILFLMETDQIWTDAIEDELAQYKHVLRQPQSNYYGAIFATNLEVINAEAVFLSDDDTPIILAELEGQAGRFFFVGLHPQPPVPGVNTEDRDEQIKKAAILADRTYLPVVAMGDFNDVAWSWTAERFREYGEFRDPRVGRGMLASFDATSWLMRFPIDQLYLTEGLELVTFERLESIGSDHFPMKAVIAVSPKE